MRPEPLQTTMILFTSLTTLAARVAFLAPTKIPSYSLNLQCYLSFRNHLYDVLPLPRVLPRLLVHPLESGHNVQHRRGQKHDEDAREDAQHQRKDDLDLGLPRSLLGVLPPLGANVLGESGQCLRNRSEEHTSELQSLRHLVC